MDVTIYTQHNQRPLATVFARILRVSPTGKVLTIQRSDKARPTRFYHVHGYRYVETPGSGIAGRMLNDYVTVSPADLLTLKA